MSLGIVLLLLLVTHTSFVDRFLRVLFGYVSYVVVVILLVNGLWLIGFSHPGSSRKERLYGSILGLLSCSWIVGTAELLSLEGMDGLYEYISTYSGILGSLPYHGLKRLMSAGTSIFFSVVLVSLLCSYFFHEPVVEFLRHAARLNGTESTPQTARCDRKDRIIPSANLTSNDRTTFGLEQFISMVQHTNSNRFEYSVGRDSKDNLVSVPIGNLLIAGLPGGGKTSLVHAVVISLVFRYSPSDVHVCFIGGKPGEFSSYEGLPHLHRPVEEGYVGQRYTLSDIERELIMRGRTDNADLPILVCVLDEVLDLDVKRFAKLMNLAKSRGIFFVMTVGYPVGQFVAPQLRKFFTDRIALRSNSRRNGRFFLDVDGAEVLPFRTKCLVKDRAGIKETTLPLLGKGMDDLKGILRI